jgi:hypothetical protein
MSADHNAGNPRKTWLHLRPTSGKLRNWLTQFRNNNTFGLQAPFVRFTCITRAVTHVVPRKAKCPGLFSERKSISLPTFSRTWHRRCLKYLGQEQVPQKVAQARGFHAPCREYSMPDGHARTSDNAMGRFTTEDKCVFAW